ncbi:hypothetical protein NQ317_011696 [Molorchus minor]|uniref:Uncharacterized protein n=1 Tax=Molorchus minor TaxID=1323400 RepID=A0ABQ9JQS0_9CUCU|nr:hypothetical protein NQ317_011696 [Molorchus minor]
MYFIFVEVDFKKQVCMLGCLASFSCLASITTAVIEEKDMSCCHRRRYIWGKTASQAYEIM